MSFTTNCVTSYERCCTDSSLSHWWPADITDCAKETRKKPDASSGDRVRSFLCMNVAVSLQQVSDGNVCIDEPANRIQFKLWMSEVNLSHFHQKNARISLQNPLQADYLHLIWLLWPLSTDACASSVFFLFFFQLDKMWLSVSAQLTEVSPCCIVQYGRLQILHVFVCGSFTLGVLSRGDNFPVTTLKDVILAATNVVPLFFSSWTLESFTEQQCWTQRVYL